MMVSSETAEDPEQLFDRRAVLRFSRPVGVSEGIDPALLAENPLFASLSGEKADPRRRPLLRVAVPCDCPAPCSSLIEQCPRLAVLQIASRDLRTPRNQVDAVASTTAGLALRSVGCRATGRDGGPRRLLGSSR